MLLAVAVVVVVAAAVDFVLFEIISIHTFNMLNSICFNRRLNNSTFRSIACNSLFQLPLLLAFFSTIFYSIQCTHKYSFDSYVYLSVHLSVLLYGILIQCVLAHSLACCTALCTVLHFFVAVDMFIIAWIQNRARIKVAPYK